MIARSDTWPWGCSAAFASPLDAPYFRLSFRGLERGFRRRCVRDGHKSGGCLVVWSQTRVGFVRIVRSSGSDKLMAAGACDGGDHDMSLALIGVEGHFSELFRPAHARAFHQYIVGAPLLLCQMPCHLPLTRRPQSRRALFDVAPVHLRHPCSRRARPWAIGKDMQPCQVTFFH